MVQKWATVSERFYVLNSVGVQKNCCIEDVAKEMYALATNLTTLPANHVQTIIPGFID